jgi:hypothetical protein
MIGDGQFHPEILQIIRFDGAEACDKLTGLKLEAGLDCL